MRIEAPNVSMADRIFLYSGLSLLLIVGALFAAFFIKYTNDRNVFYTFTWGFAAANWIIVYYAKRLFPHLRTKFTLFVLAVGVSAFFVTQVTIPINTLSISVRYIPSSIEVVLGPDSDMSRENQLSLFKARGATNSDISFRLRQPLTGRKKPFKIFLGSDPKTYHIFRLSYGTDFWFWDIPMAMFMERDVLRVASVTVQADNLTALDSGDVRLYSKIGSKPTLYIDADENFVRSSTSRSKIYKIKILWFLFYVATSALILWSHVVTTATRRMRRIIQDYLEG